MSFILFGKTTFVDLSFPIIIIINLDAKRRVYGAEVENTYKFV